MGKMQIIMVAKRHLSIRAFSASVLVRYSNSNEEKKLDRFYSPIEHSHDIWLHHTPLLYSEGDEPFQLLNFFFFAPMQGRKEGEGFVVAQLWKVVLNIVSSGRGRRCLISWWRSDMRDAKQANQAKIRTFNGFSFRHSTWQWAGRRVG